MTEQEFSLKAKAMATAYLDTTAQSGLSPDDVSNLAGASLGEVLAQQLGIFGAVERLRMLADVMEKQVLDDAMKGVD